LGFGCSEYAIKSAGDIEEVEDTGPDIEDTDTQQPLVPDALVEPSAIDLGVICGTGGSSVTMSNVGEAALTVTEISVSDAGWTADYPSLPVTLAPEEVLEVTLGWTDGDAVLSFVTDDPDEPVIEVPLSATVDVAPTVQIDVPVDGDVLAPGDATLFSGQMSDDSDPLEELSVEWSSDVDGVISTQMPDGSGVTEFEWDSGAWSSGTHTVTLTVEDTCGNQAQDTVVFCQNEGYVEDNLDLTTWNFEGDANWDGTNSWVELTTAATDQAGTAFQTSATVDADNVSISFNFYASGGSGADGLSLTALDSTRMTSFVGSTGGGIGYQGLPGWSIEVDTWYNSENSDPTSDDHLSFHLDGDVSTPLTWVTLPDMEDGLWHLMEISVIGTWVTVAIDGTTYIDESVAGITNFPAYVGFTASTGSATNEHLIDALEVEGFVCDE